MRDLGRHLGNVQVAYLYLQPKHSLANSIDRACKWFMTTVMAWLHYTIIICHTATYHTMAWLELPCFDGFGPPKAPDGFSGVLAGAKELFFKYEPRLSSVTLREIWVGPNTLRWFRDDICALLGNPECYKGVEDCCICLRKPLCLPSFSKFLFSICKVCTRVAELPTIKAVFWPLVASILRI